MQRRDFLAAAATAGMVTAIPNTSTAQQGRLLQRRNSTNISSTLGDKRSEAKLRFSSQLSGWLPGKNEVEKMAQMKKWGFDAVEVGGNFGGDHNLCKEFKKKANDAGLKVSVICGGVGSAPCSGNPEEARQGVDKLKKWLEGAAILECNGVIFVPAFNGEQERLGRTHQQLRRSLIDIDPNTKEIKGGFLKEAGDFAASLKTNIILEPLNRKEAWFLRQVADAASICRDSQSDGVKTMGDFYHMFYEEACDMGAFIAGGQYVKHVHFGSGNQRILPGQDPAQSFVAGFRGLKYIGYKEFMSFECGCLGGDDKGAVEVPKTLEFLKQSWNEA